MALTDLVLKKGEVIVTLSNSILGLAANGKALNFGTVQAINDLCDTTSIGASVLFDITKALPFRIISGQVFYMIDEKDIIGSETALP